VFKSLEEEEAIANKYYKLSSQAIHDTIIKELLSDTY